MSHDQVFDWLDDIDFYIQPSKQEGLPRSMVEAISRACPSAGSTAGGMSELVSSDYIFHKANVNEIVNLIDSLTKEKLTQEACRNFKTAQNYKKEVLDAKRRTFYKNFAERCWQHKQGEI